MPTDAIREMLLTEIEALRVVLAAVSATAAVCARPQASAPAADAEPTERRNAPPLPSVSPGEHAEPDSESTHPVRLAEEEPTESVRVPSFAVTH